MLRRAHGLAHDRELKSAVIPILLLLRGVLNLAIEDRVGAKVVDAVPGLDVAYPSVGIASAKCQSLLGLPTPVLSGEADDIIGPRKTYQNEGGVRWTLHSTKNGGCLGVRYDEDDRSAIIGLGIVPQDGAPKLDFVVPLAEKPTFVDEVNHD